MSALQACLQLYAASRRRGRKLLFDVRPNAFHLFFAEGAHGLLQVCICAENQDENGLASKLRKSSPAPAGRLSTAFNIPFSLGQSFTEGFALQHY
jgi:hypothetical protein